MIGVRIYGPDDADHPRCVVAHPDAGGPCGRPAVGEVWAMPFCEVHGREAGLAAQEEWTYTVGEELNALAEAEDRRPDKRAPVLRVLDRGVQTEARWTAEEGEARRDALAAAYPAEELEARIHPETAGFDYAREYSGDGPVEWWTDACMLTALFMRRASGQGLALLTRQLELLREQATAQRVLAERDYERRYVEPRKTMRGKGSGAIEPESAVRDIVPAE